jgi:hypothetical protein
MEDLEDKDLDTNPPTLPDLTDPPNEEEEEEQKAPPIEVEQEFEFEEEIFEEKEFSIKQKFVAILTGVVSFLFFLILLFPYEEIARYYILKAASENQLSLDFKNLNLPFFGSKSVDGLIYQGKDGFELKAETIELDSSYSTLMDRSFKGEIQISSLKLDISELGIDIKTLSLTDSEIDHFDKGIAGMNLSIHLEALNGKIKRSPNIPVLESLKDTIIKSIQLSVKKEKNSFRLRVEKLALNTNLAKLEVTGNIELNDFFKNSKLDLKICPELSKEYKEEREDVAGYFQMAMKSEKCFILEGTIGQPKPKFPGLEATQPNPNNPSSMPKSP